MLPAEFKEQSENLIASALEDIESEYKNRFSQRSAEFAARGLMAPPNLGAIHHELAIWKAQERVQRTWAVLKRVLDALAVPYSDDLATDLKNIIEPLVSLTWCRQLIDKYGIPPKEQDRRIKLEEELISNKGKFLRRIFAEVDLKTAEIKNTLGVESKEFEPKFKILFSSHQANKDFDQWNDELKPKDRTIAFLFFDIDDFKKLNTRYTETVVDQTILPQAMNFLMDLTKFRGGAYGLGGDEFLIILPNIDEKEAKSFAEALRENFKSIEFSVGEKKIPNFNNWCCTLAFAWNDF